MKFNLCLFIRLLIKLSKFIKFYHINMKIEKLMKDYFPESNFFVYNIFEKGKKKCKSTKEFKSNNGTLLPYGVGMLLFKIVPFVKTVLMKHVLNAKINKVMMVNHVWFHGVHVTMHITLIVSVNGLTRRKIHVHFVKKPGLL